VTAAIDDPTMSHLGKAKAATLAMRDHTPDRGDNYPANQLYDDLMLVANLQARLSIAESLARIVELLEDLTALPRVTL